MPSSWWIDENDLDDSQKSVINADIDKGFAVAGPPGSGKTNLLLLRAQYLYLSGLKNLRVISFTRALKNFIVSGGQQYQFPNKLVQTLRAMQLELLRDYGGAIPALSGKFSEDRAKFLMACDDVIKKRKLTKIFDALLLDEAQDLLPEEIDQLNGLTRRMILVADQKQQIYEGKMDHDYRKWVADEYVLKHHYRCGRKICTFVDKLPVWGDKPGNMVDTSNYNEKVRPSSVQCMHRGTREQVVTTLLSELKRQMKSYPDELIGVLCPVIPSVDEVGDYLSSSDIGDSVQVVGKDVNAEISEERPIVVCTCHSAKGLEFRAAHLVFGEEVAKLKLQPNLVFMTASRAKTSFTIYHVNPMRSFIDSALAAGAPPMPVPKLSAVFAPGKR